MIVIELPKLLPAPSASRRVDGPCEIIEVDFSEAARLEGALEDLEMGWADLELTPGKMLLYATGDGRLLLLQSAPTGSPAVLGTFTAETVARNINHAKHRHWRLSTELTQSRCPHPQGARLTKTRRTECGECGKVWKREPKYRNCRSFPKAGACYQRCRRREGHKGVCSWHPDWHWKKEL